MVRETDEVLKEKDGVIIERRVQLFEHSKLRSSG